MIGQKNSLCTVYFQVILESGTQFKDSVVHVQFSNDGMYLAAADLSGVIKVWKLNGDITLNREIVWEFETSDISVSCSPTANLECYSFLTFVILFMLEDICV